jgi:hypothetical protein
MSFAAWKSRPIARRPALIGRPPRCLALAAMIAALGATAAPARADVGATIIERCTHGQSLSGFTQQDYRKALQELPAEVEEYSDCANLIRRAQLNAAGGAGGAGGAEGLAPIPLTSSERAALHSASRTGGAPQQIGGQLVRPGVVKASVASALSTLPAPLLAILAFLIAVALLWGGNSIRERVLARRSS